MLHSFCITFFIIVKKRKRIENIMQNYIGNIMHVIKGTIVKKKKMDQVDRNRHQNRLLSTKEL